MSPKKVLPEVFQLTIAELQQAIIDEGWQFAEHIFNDGWDKDCYVKMTKETPPSSLSSHSLGTIGWGRFSRRTCWEQAYNCIILKKKGD